MLFPLPFLLSFGFVHSSLFFFRQFFTSKQSQCPRKTSFLLFYSPPTAARERKKVVGDTPNPGREDPAPLKSAPMGDTPNPGLTSIHKYRSLATSAIFLRTAPSNASFLSCCVPPAAG